MSYSPLIAGWFTAFLLSLVPALLVAQPLETDMSITQSDFPDPVVASYSVFYDFTVTNEGNEDAGEVTVTITLPTQTSFVTGAHFCDEDSGIVTCSLGAMNVSDSRDFQIEVAVDSDASGTLTNTATVSADIADPNSSNNTAMEQTTVIIPLPTPSIIFPANNAVLTDTRPIFRWSAVPGAVAYEFALDLQNPITETYLIYKTEFQTAGPMIYDTYYWQVRAIGLNNLVSAWSPVYTLVMNSPPNAAPVRNAYNDYDVTLTWTPLAGATAYQIQFSDNASFFGYAPVGPVLPADKAFRTISFGVGTWYWHVRAQRANGQWSNWSATDSFQVIVP